MKNISPDTKIIAVEPKGAASYFESKKAGQVVELEKIDKFVDGAAVKKSAPKPFKRSKPLSMTLCLSRKEKCAARFSNYIINAPS